MLKYSLPFYIAEMFAILLLCCGTPCIVTLLSYSQSQYIYPFFWIAELMADFANCVAFPNLKPRLRYTLSCYIAEIFPTSKYCWCISCLSIAELHNSVFYCSGTLNFIVLLYPILIHGTSFPEPNTFSKYTCSLPCLNIPKLKTLLGNTLFC